MAGIPISSSLAGKPGNSLKIMSTIAFPANSVLLITGINETKGYRVYDDEQPLKDCIFCDTAEDGAIELDKGHFYKMLVREYGRCTGRVYVDNCGKASPVGWVFQKRMKYEDCDEFYLQETWVHFATVTPKRYADFLIP